jgi:predicted enzyme related to lactoylglutathione lyase
MKLDRAQPGTVAWVDLATPDLEQSRRFYGELLGWSFVGGEDAETSFYTLAQLGGRNVAGMARRPSMSPFPPAWTVYIATDDVDALARKVADAGGKIVMGPMDVMEEGRMAYFADPTGARFGAWQPRRHAGAQLIDEPGAMTWHEVYTRNAEKARAFYGPVLGVEARPLDAPGVEYWTMQLGPRTAFGLMQMSDAYFPKEVPSHWNTYFAVRDVEAAAKQVAALGGTVVAPPFDTPYGRMTAIDDPSGAGFCLITPVKAMH